MVDLARLAPGPIGPLAGMEYVRQRGMEGQQRGQQNALSRLAGQAYNAPQADRQAIFGQMAQVDPATALKTEQAFQQRDTDARAELSNQARLFVGLVDKSPELAQQVYSGLAQTAQRAGFNVPPAYDPSHLEGIKAIAAYTPDPAKGIGVQSTYVDDQGIRWAIMRDGSTQMLGRNNASIRVLEPEGAVPYGVVTSGGRAGEMVGIGGGAPAPQAAPAPVQTAGTPDQGGDVAQQAQAHYQRLRAAGLDDGAANLATEAWLTDMGYREAPSAPAASPSSRVPVMFDPINGGAMGATPPRTPTAAEKAGAAERAKLEAQLSYAPEIAASEAEAARLKKEAEAQGERAANAPKRIAQYQQALTASENVRTSIDRALGMIGPMSTGFMGARMRGVEGSPAYNLAAEIETVKANLGFDRLQQMRDNSPTGGALGAIAVQELVALQSTIANLDPNQSAEQIAANLGRVKTHYENWQSAVRNALADEQRGGQQGDATSSGVDDLLSKYGAN